MEDFMLSFFFCNYFFCDSYYIIKQKGGLHMPTDNFNNNFSAPVEDRNCCCNNNGFLGGCDSEILFFIIIFLLLFTNFGCGCRG